MTTAPALPADALTAIAAPAYQPLRSYPGAIHEAGLKVMIAQQVVRDILSEQSAEDAVIEQIVSRDPDARNDQMRKAAKLVLQQETSYQDILERLHVAREDLEIKQAIEERLRNEFAVLKLEVQLQIANAKGQF